MAPGHPGDPQRTTLRPRPTAYLIRRGDDPFPEAEIRNQYEINHDGSIGPFRTPSFVHDAIDKGAVARDYSSIKVPIVTIFALQRPVEEKPDESAEVRSARKKIRQMEFEYIGRYADLVRQANVETRILEWTGAKHYVFLSNEADVLHEMKGLVSRLK